MSYSCERCGAHLQDLATQCGCGLPPTSNEVARARIGHAAPIMDALTAERDRLAAENAELRKERDRARKWEKGYFDVADSICAESSGPEDLARQAREIRLERDAANATLYALRGKARRGCIDEVEPIRFLYDAYAILYPQPKETPDDEQ